MHWRGAPSLWACALRSTTGRGVGIAVPPPRKTLTQRSSSCRAYAYTSTRDEAIQLFHHRSGQSEHSHVDLGLDVVNTDHPVYDIVHALADGAVPLHEARVAMALALGEEPKGFRHIEQVSGLTDDSILKVLPEAGATTTLLRCTNRGKFAYDETERQQINLAVRRYRPGTSVGHPSTYSLSPSNPLRVVEGVEDQKKRELETRSVRQMSALGTEVLALLDPSLDVWKNATEGYGDRQEFGDAGWALAVVTGMKPTLLASGEISRIIRVGERQVRRFVDKLVRWGWAKRVREGRLVKVLVDFSLMTHEDLREDYLKFARRAHKARLAQYEQFVVKRLGTRVGREARDMWQNRIREIRMLKDWAQMSGSRCWDRMIEVLSDTKASRWWGERELIRLMDPLTA